MLTKDNVTIGIERRFAPDWPGQRGSAKTRRGTACPRPTNKKNGRCRLHGGASTGAKTQEGQARIAAGEGVGKLATVYVDSTISNYSESGNEGH